jgi:hypothetical protein
MILNLFLPNTLLTQRQDCFLSLKLIDPQNILFTISATPSPTLFLSNSTSTLPNNLDYVFILRDSSSIDLILTKRSETSYSVILYSPPKVSHLQSYSISGLSLRLDEEKTVESVDTLQFKLSVHAKDKPAKDDGLNRVIQSINTISTLIDSPSPYVTALFNTILTLIYLFTSSIGFNVSTTIVKLLTMKLTSTFSLLDISSTLVQLHLRLTQAMLWPGRWREWRSSPQLSQAKYIGYSPF